MSYGDLQQHEHENCERDLEAQKRERSREINGGEQTDGDGWFRAWYQWAFGEDFE